MKFPVAARDRLRRRAERPRPDHAQAGGPAVLSARHPGAGASARQLRRARRPRAARSSSTARPAAPRCHVPPLYTEPGWNRHTPEEIGIDSFQADRSPDGRYRTTPLKGLWTHAKGGFYHDGRFATLRDVVDHYDGHFALALTEQQKNDLVEFLKSL